MKFLRKDQQDFPQIEKFNDDVYISWTDNSELGKKVRVTKIPLLSI